MAAKRNTIQRQIIRDALNGFKTHPSVDEIYSAIQKIHPTISKSTVYRNLNQLSKDGEIMQIAVTDDVARYDGCCDPHYHCSCKVCGSISDVDMEYVEGIDQKVSSDYGFNVEKHDIIFVGTCKDCTDKDCSE